MTPSEHDHLFYLQPFCPQPSCFGCFMVSKPHFLFPPFLVSYELYDSGLLDLVWVRQSLRLGCSISSRSIPYRCRRVLRKAFHWDGAGALHHVQSELLLLQSLFPMLIKLQRLFCGLPQYRLRIRITSRCNSHMVLRS